MDFGKKLEYTVEEREWFRIAVLNAKITVNKAGLPPERVRGYEKYLNLFWENYDAVFQMYRKANPLEFFDETSRVPN